MPETLVSTLLVCFLASLCIEPCVCASPSHTLRHRQHGDVLSSSPSGNTFRRSVAASQFSDALNGTLQDDDFGGDVLTVVSSGTQTTLPATSAQPTEPPITEYVINEHQEARFACDVPELVLNLVQIFWFHDGVQVEASGHRYSRDKESGALTVTNARREDDGVWVCEAREATSRRRVLHTGPATKLIVLVPPREPYLLLDGRRLDAGNQFVPVKENMKIGVECVAEGGNPAPTIAWRLVRAERAIERSMDAVAVATSTSSAATSEEVDLESGPAEIHGDRLNSSAKIARVQRTHHNATVSCVISHPTLPGPLNASLLLDVEYAPSFSITKVPGFGFPVYEGLPVSLKCDVDSNPPSTPIWQKDDATPPVEQSPDGFLNFSSIRKDHSGWYRCTCRHLTGEYSSSAYYLTVRDAKEASSLVHPDADPVGASLAGGMRSMDTPLGASVQLDCPCGQGSCWRRMDSSGSPFAAEGPSLSFNSVLYQDAGKYQCGKPDLGASEDRQRWLAAYTLQLSVTGRPVVQPVTQTVSARQGQTVTLTVDLCANPPTSQVVWASQHRLLWAGTRAGRHFARALTAGSRPDCHQAVLVMQNVDRGDEGEYLLFVRNPRGVADATVILNVTEASGLSTEGVASGKAHALVASIAVQIYLVLFLTVVLICANPDRTDLGHP